MGTEPLGKVSPQLNGAGAAAALPPTRCEDHLEEAENLLRTWRDDTWVRHFSMSPFGPAGVLPDRLISAIARDLHGVQTIDDLVRLNWGFAEVYGDHVLALLRELDQKWATKSSLAGQGGNCGAKGVPGAVEKTE